VPFRSGVSVLFFQDLNKLAATEACVFILLDLVTQFGYFAFESFILVQKAVDFLTELEDLLPEKIPLFFQNIHLFAGFISKDLHLW